MADFTRLLALAAVAPFLLAFAPSEESGTTVSVSAGSGRAVTASGCSRPRLAEAVDQQVGVHHQWAYRADESRRFGVGLDANMAQSREKECTEEDCRNGGWYRNPVASSLSPYATLDWRWLGLMAGSQVPLHLLYTDGSSHTFHPAEWLGIPFRGSLRLGYPERFYLSLGLLDGQPVFSGTAFPIGLGGRILGTDVWAAPYPDYEELGLSGRVARRFGPVRLRLSGRWHRDPIDHDGSDSDGFPGDEESFRIYLPEFAVSAGIDYHLPW